MKVRQHIKIKWRDNVCKIFREFGRESFTSTDVNQIVDMSPQQKAGMFNGLRNGGVLLIENGGRRGFYHSNNPNKTISTRWQFAPWFVEYMQNGGLEDLESE